MLSRLKKQLQTSRRMEEGSRRWRLYTTKAGNVPKELLAMFAGVLREEKDSGGLPEAMLTEVETEVLRQVLRFIDRHGVVKMQSVAAADDEAVPVIKSVAGAKGIRELKVQTSANNPRFLFAVCKERAVFLTAFKKKSQKLAKSDIDRARKRYKDWKKREGC